MINNAGIAQLGTTLFINKMPLSVNNGILLRNPINGTKIDHELKGHYNTEFKVIVRTTSYEDGYVLMRKVFKLLTLDNYVIEDMHIKHCYPDNEPIEYPISEGNMIELASDFKIAFGEIV